MKLLSKKQMQLKDDNLVLSVAVDNNNNLLVRRNTFPYQWKKVASHQKATLTQRLSKAIPPPGIKELYTSTKES